MRTLQTNDAAALLSVTPGALLAWEDRFGYPKPMRYAAGQRLYAYDELLVLRDTLASELSIAAAISNTRQALAAGGNCGPPATNTPKAST